MRNCGVLKRLYISNFALISEMEVFFPGRLTVITGETGAGKSIFLEALGLALGRRADLLALKNAAKKCVVEAEFENVPPELNAILEEQGLDYASDIILRREITADGKSRSFLNDSPVNLNLLKLLSEKLIDIHSQHETLLLNENSFQLSVMDAFGGSAELFDEYRQEYAKLGKLEKELAQLSQQEAAARKELDYLRFLLDELEAAEIEPGGLKLLEEESAQLENAETIKTALLSAAHAIAGSEQNLLSGINLVKQQISGITKYSENYTLLLERVQSLIIELKDLAASMEQEEGRVEANTMRLDDVNSRIDRLNRLLRKHNAATEEELLKIKEETEEKLNHFSSLETTIGLISKQIEKTKTSCLKKAKQLSELRTKARQGIESEVKVLLAGLAMEKAEFRIHITQLEKPGPDGLDTVDFLFSANKGQPLSPIQKVASGGELSRLMLSIKSLLAKHKQLPAIIFDEIDTGVSGDVADKIGNILLQMGQSMQVISITHLPQIACKGSHHLFVYKTEEADKTVSNIRELEGDNRVTEIAKMLSTGTPSASAIVNAKELLRFS